MGCIQLFSILSINAYIYLLKAPDLIASSRFCSFSNSRSNCACLSAASISFLILSFSALCFSISANLFCSASTRFFSCSSSFFLLFAISSCLNRSFSFFWSSILFCSAFLFLSILSFSSLISLNLFSSSAALLFFSSIFFGVIKFSSFIKEALSINGRFGIFALEVSYTKIKEANKAT